MMLVLKKKLNKFNPEQINALYILYYHCNTKKDLKWHKCIIYKCGNLVYSQEYVLPIND